MCSILNIARAVAKFHMIFTLSATTEYGADQVPTAAKIATINLQEIPF